MLLGVYSYVAYLALNPNVSDAYRDYYITQESGLSPTEIQRQVQKQSAKSKASRQENSGSSFTTDKKPL